MQNYQHAEIESFYSSGLRETFPCQVRFDEDKIVISYERDGGYDVWEGVEEQAPRKGHFSLQLPISTEDGRRSNEIRGRATMHMLPEGERLEGSWVQDGEAGMSRIDLNEPMAVKESI